MVGLTIRADAPKTPDSVQADANTPLLANSEVKKTATVSRGFFAWLASFFSCFTRKSPTLKQKEIEQVINTRMEVKQTAQKTNEIQRSTIQPKLHAKPLPTTYEVNGKKYNLQEKDLRLPLADFRVIPSKILANGSFKTVSLGGEEVSSITEKDMAKFSVLQGRKYLSFQYSPNLTILPIQELLALPQSLTIDLQNIGYGDPETKFQAREAAYTALREGLKSGIESEVRAAFGATMDKLDLVEKSLDAQIAVIEKAMKQKDYKGPKFLFSTKSEREYQRMTSAQKAEHNRNLYGSSNETTSYESQSVSSSSSYQNDYSAPDKTGKYSQASFDSGHAW